MSLASTHLSLITIIYLVIRKSPNIALIITHGEASSKDSSQASSIHYRQTYKGTAPTLHYIRDSRSLPKFLRIKYRNHVLRSYRGSSGSRRFIRYEENQNISLCSKQGSEFHQLIIHVLHCFHPRLQAGRRPDVSIPIWLTQGSTIECGQWKQ